MSHPDDNDLRNAQRAWAKHERRELIRKNNKPINNHEKQCKPLHHNVLPLVEQTDIIRFERKYVCPMCCIETRSREPVQCGMCGCKMEEC